MKKVIIIAVMMISNLFGMEKLEEKPSLESSLEKENLTQKINNKNQKNSCLLESSSARVSGFIFGYLIKKYSQDKIEFIYNLFLDLNLSASL